MWSFVRGEDCWICDQSPTLAKSGKDHGFISMGTISIGLRPFGVKPKSKAMRVYAQSGQYHTNVEICEVRYL